MNEFNVESTPLFPPMVVNGEPYGLGVKIHPTDGQVDALIVSGTFEYAPTGGEVICARAMQQSSITTVIEMGNSFEEIWNSSMGGNICATVGPQRVYNFVNSESYRGPNTNTRAMVGDVLWYNGKGFLITGCHPFGEAPPEVSYGGSAHYPKTTYLNPGIYLDSEGYKKDINDLTLEEPDKTQNFDAELFFDTDNTGLFYDCGLYVESSPDVWDKMTRKVFASLAAPTIPEPTYYPDDAAFSQTLPEYWFDPYAWLFRVGSATGLTGDRLWAFYYEKNLVGVDGGVLCLTGTGAGYGMISGGEEDSVFLINKHWVDDFEKHPFMIYKYGGAPTYGAGAIEFRLENAADAVFVGLSWAGDNLATLSYRETKGGVIQFQAFPVQPAFTDLIEVLKMSKVGGVFTFYLGDTLIGSVTLPGVVAGCGGYIGVATITECKVNMSAGDIRIVPFSPGTLSRQLGKEFKNTVFFVEMDLATLTEPIQSIELIDLELAMSASSTPQRNNYTITADKFKFTSETFGDKVKVVYAAKPGIPSKPGRNPRVFNSTGFSTDHPTIDKTASTVVSENVANWFDKLTVDDPDGELTATPGESFTIKRNPSLHGTITISHDIKNAAGDLVLVPASNYLSKPTEGLFIFKQSWLDTLPPGEPLCLKFKCDRFIQKGNCKARQINDINKAVNSIDGVAWTPISINGSGGSGTSGLTGINGEHGRNPRFGPTGYETFNGGSDIRGTDYAWGTTYGELCLGYNLPGWCGEPSYIVYRAGETITDSYKNEIVIYNDDRTEWKNRDDLISPNSYIDTSSPYGAGFGARGPINQEGPYFGSPVPTVAPVKVTGGRYNFTARGIGVSGILARLPTGSVCVEAFARVKFDGLKHWAWSFSEYIKWTREGEDREKESQLIVNGVEVFHYKETGGVVVIDEGNQMDRGTPVVTGNVGFQLFGKRLHSENVTLVAPAGKIAQVHKGDYRIFGSVPTGSVTSGVWSLVDITGAVNGILTARGTPFTELFLYPSCGCGLEALGYASSLLPSLGGSLSYHEDGASAFFTSNKTGAGSFNEFSGLSIAEVVARFRLPSGVEQQITIPLNLPAFAP
jgi:hypothetical protein